MLNFLQKLLKNDREEIEEEELNLEESHRILLEILNTIEKIKADNPKPDLLELQNGTIKMLFDSINYQLVKENDEARKIYMKVKGYFLDNKML